MASSLETNKILAAILTAGIFASGAGVMSRIIYHPTVPEEPSYIIEVAAEAEGGGAGDGGSEAVPLATLLASADVAGGESGAKKCAACHTFEEGGANKIGPNLYGTLGRDIASVPGFAYSEALAGIEGDWNYESLDAFLTKPKDFAPGTKMAYAGMRSVEDRADLILYLRSLAASPLPLPEAGTDTAEETSGGESEGEEEVAAAAEDTAEEAEETAAAAVEQAEDVADEAEDAAGEMAKAAADVVEGAEETATAVAETAQDAASEAVETVEEAATDASETAESVVEGAVEQAADATEAVSAAAASGLVAMIAAGDVAKGEKVSKKCKACHVFEEGGKNKLGPPLWGVVGRDIGSHEGFTYSGALSDLEGDWSYDKLDQFLAAPKNYIPGTKMVFAGVKKEQDRADLIAYLRTLDSDPAPLN